MVFLLRLFGATFIRNLLETKSIFPTTEQEAVQD